MATTDNISLDRVRTDHQFNFQSVYEQEYIDDLEEIDSTFEQGMECEYINPEEFNSKSKEYLNSTSYLHLNCRSLSSNWESFKSLICELHGDTFSFDYIGISEVFSCLNDDRLTLLGYYKLITKTRSDDIHGVGLFIK